MLGRPVQRALSDEDTYSYIDEKLRGKEDVNSINDRDLPPNEIEVSTIEEIEVNNSEKTNRI